MGPGQNTLLGETAPPTSQFVRFYYYFADKPWLPMADNIVVGYGNGVQMFQRRAIIEIDKANYHSITAFYLLTFNNLLTFTS